MKKSFKKMLSLFLATLMTLSVMVPASAAATSSSAWGSDEVGTIPVVTVFGDGDSIHDENGKKLMQYKDLLSGSSDEKDNDNEVMKSVVNVLMPFLVYGLGSGNYEPYYDALQKEIGELFEEILLDENGEANNGTQFNPSHAAIMARRRHENTANANGKYGIHDYIFWYDWRLDPLVIADQLKAYIDDVKEATGKDEVALVGRCLGSNVVTAYVAKYGMDGIRGLGIDGGVVNGAEALSETISGKFRFDANAINRFLYDCNALELFSLDSFVNETIDMLEKAGVFDAIVGVTKEKIYYTVVQGITSALALSTFFTYPSYWAAVKTEDYETAKYYVFGAEGSAKRQKYAGLIEKIDNYNEVVRERIPEIMAEADEKGNICIIAKYGLQILPFVKSNTAIADQFASVTCASYGATTSSIYSTLGDKYIQQRVSEGKGKYISPDKQVDASTCQFPDTTWFVKGANHSDWTAVENTILSNVLTSSTQLTVDDCPYTQFVVAIKQPGKDVYGYSNYTYEAMTENNCDTYYFKADERKDTTTDPYEKLFVFVLTLLKWLVKAIAIIADVDISETTKPSTVVAA